MTSLNRILRVLPFIFIIMHTSVVCGQSTDQVLSLDKGWNAVWLEIEPTYPDGHARAGMPMAAEDAFNTATNSEFEIIASPKLSAGLAPAFGNAEAKLSKDGDFSASEWEVWRKSSSIPNSLDMITGNRGYLVKMTKDKRVNVTGKAIFYKPAWTPDRYNLVGFGIDDANRPRFDNFFAPSNGRHPVTGNHAIFALSDNGKWEAVNATARMAPGKAYWIFANGPSDYMGPVAVDFDLSLTGRLNFGGLSDAVPVGAEELDLEEIVFTNIDATGSNAIPEMELISGSGELELHIARPTADSLGFDLGNQIDSTAGDGSSSALMETVPPSGTAVLTLGAKRNWGSGQAGRTNLYRIKPGGGVTYWLPVSAVRSDFEPSTDHLPDTPAGAVAGLWVGVANIDSVTSIVENGSPARPSAGSAPIRVLLHSDATGKVTLLSQVTIMQTKTADPAVAPEPVLVVDPRKIPFFEGVKERNGKRVGIRVQTVAYDMPRQAGEDYHLTWDLEGALGAGKKVSTSNALVLDPLHRSNPFRHAFHQKHTSGTTITRKLSIDFDAEQTIPDRLRGTFTDTIKDLINTDLELSGPIELQRVSAVDALQL